MKEAPSLALPKTRLVRVADDLADKLSWLARLTGRSVSDRLDPIIRPPIEAEYASIAEAVAAIRAIESQHCRPEPARLGGGA